MAISTIKILGKDELLRKLDQHNFNKPVSDAIRKMTIWFEANVKVSTPVDTGRLRSSIASRIEPQAGEIFTNVQYAPFIEYGTHKMEARHVMRGSSARIKGKGMFTYTLEQLQQKMSESLGGLAQAIKVRFE